MRKGYYTFIAIFLAALVLTSTINYGSIYAQNNTEVVDNITSLENNKSIAVITDQPQISILNKTTIPAKQTIININQSVNPIQGNLSLDPLRNQNLVDQPISLNETFDEKTIVQPTGAATTTIVNKTVVPFNQTMLSGETMNDTQADAQNQTGQQQQQQQQGQNQTGQQQQQQQQGQNQTGQQQQQQQQGQNQTGQGGGPIAQFGGQVQDVFNGTAQGGGPIAQFGGQVQETFNGSNN